MGTLFFNKGKKRLPEIDDPGKEPLEFHRKLPGYRPSSLVLSASSAARLGVSRVIVKDESSRLGLPSFKILGASWAVYRSLQKSFNIDHGAWSEIGQLHRYACEWAPGGLVTATDGNHGRGVARVASWLGLKAHVFVPGGTAVSRIEGIESEGARVEVVEGDYDEAVRAARASASEKARLVQDTAWPGYEETPRWIVQGYWTILLEAADQMEDMGESVPDLVAVQIGVGSLAAAVTGYYRSRFGGDRPFMLAVEPEGSACAFESARAGNMITMEGPHTSVMAGLNCGTLSSAAWPVLRNGVDAFCVVGDEAAFDAMRVLKRDGIVSGESGSAALAGLLDLLGGRKAKYGLGSFNLNGGSSVLVISTEGITG